MGDSLLERMNEAKHEYEVAFVSFFGDCTRTDDYYMMNNFNNASKKDAFNAIENTLCQFARYYSIHEKYNSLDLDLSLGIVYNKEDVNEDNTLKENAEPIPNVVRVYTEDSRCYQNRDKVEGKLNSMFYGSQCFITFDNLLERINDEGLIYYGPDSYEEVKEAILSGEKVTATISANLNQKKNKSLVKK